MQHYEFQRRLKTVYDKAVATYGRGERNVNMFFDRTELEFLRAIGATPMEIYDYAEDLNSDGEPDWETVLLVQAIRRDYFLQVQGGAFSQTTLSEAAFPAREDEIEGISWLPRLILKARSKLKGELPEDLMYVCGGDRKFFREHDIHPAEFLHLTWSHLDNDAAIVRWVLERSGRPLSVPDPQFPKS